MAKWRNTDYGFTDGVHQHHCMVNFGANGTVEYLNSIPTAIEIIQDLVNQHTSSVGRCSMCGEFYCPEYCTMRDARLFLKAYAMPTM